MRRKTGCTCRKPCWRRWIFKSTLSQEHSKTQSIDRHEQLKPRRTERLEMTIDNQLRLDLLREALPYIQRFQGQTVVVKLSGKVTENPENLASLAEELALLHQVGIRICVVHGGGKQL